MKKTMNAKAKATYVNTLMEQASTGDAEAASRLADAYREGDFVAQDWEQAFRWYSVAARLGDMEAQNNLGTLYLEGFYCQEDHEKAAYWYRKSAEQGANVAQYNLGMRYIHGQGVLVDNTLAMRWLEKSAAQGYYLAYLDLGLMYLHGEGCSPDRTKALRLMMEGAAGGDDRAVEILLSKVPELEELAFEGDISDCLMLSDLFFECFELPDALAHGWAWLLWADAKNMASPVSFDAEVFARLQEIFSDKDKRGSTPVRDKKKGERLFKAMQHERGISTTQDHKMQNPSNKKTSMPVPGPARLPEKWRVACDPNGPIQQRFSKDRPEYELILDLAAEGGGVDVYGKPCGDGSWTFWSDMSDWTPTLVDEDAIHRTTEEVLSWEVAIEILDEHFPYWIDLYPCYVHPEFRKPMLDLIERRQVVKHLVGLTGEKC